MEHLDDWGGRDSYPHYAVGWAHAMDTPYQWTKQVASHWGGTRNGTIVHWPAGITAKGEVRSQFHHVIDVAPTILEAAGHAGADLRRRASSSRRWKARACSTASTTASAKDRHTIQYFEMFGNRGIYYDGWTAVTRHSIPWELSAKSTPFNDDVWELYDTNTDWTQAHDLAAEMPEKLAELQRQWLIEATRYSVLPLDDRRAERMIPAMAGRPTLIKGDTQVLFPGMAMGENNVVDIKNKSYAVTANVTFPETDAEGVIIAQGANFGGWAIYAHEGKLKYIYNFLGLEMYEVETEETAARPGTIRCGWSSPTTAAGWARAARRRSTSTASKIGEGRVEHTHATVFSADATALVGNKFGAPIGPDLEIEGNPFNGTIKGVQIDLKLDDADHMVSDAERWRVAMAIQ